MSDVASTKTASDVLASYAIDKNKAATPVTAYSTGSWSSVNPKFLVLKALPNGINMKPPVANRTVLENALR